MRLLRDATKQFVCTVISFIYLFTLLIFLMGYTLILFYLFYPDFFFYFFYLGIKFWQLMNKFWGQRLMTVKFGKPFRIGSLSLWTGFHLVEVLKGAGYFLAGLGCFIVSFISFFLFVVQFILTMIVVLLSPVDVMDLVAKYHTKYCLSDMQQLEG